jgi:toxin ParE1/3/4
LTVLRISALAREDLKNIGRHTYKNWGLEQRNNYLSQINACFEKLLTMPQIGRSCDDIRKGYRRFREGEHIIFYCFTELSLDIIRILHKNMDVENHL